MKRSHLAFGLTLIAGPVLAQELPDPGRRVIEEDRHAEQMKRSQAEEKKSYLSAPPRRPKDARACEASRVEVQMYCGAPYSAKSHSMRCAEARTLYEQNCPL